MPPGVVVPPPPPPHPLKLRPLLYELRHFYVLMNGNFQWFYYDSWISLWFVEYSSVGIVILFQTMANLLLMFCYTGDKKKVRLV
jgi:hypothetical protein